MRTKTVEIPITELAALRRKAEAHDDYLTAIRTVQARYTRLIRPSRPGPAVHAFYREGYCAAIEDLAQATADIASRRLAEADLYSQAGASELFD